jgi:hypothetical protein
MSAINFNDKDFVNGLRLMFVAGGVILAITTALAQGANWTGAITLAFLYVTFDLTLYLLSSYFFSPQVLKVCALSTAVLIVPVVLSTPMSVLSSNHYANVHKGDQALAAYTNVSQKNAESVIEKDSTAGEKKAALDRFKAAAEDMQDAEVVDKSVAMDIYLAEFFGADLESIATVKYTLFSLAFLLGYISVNGWFILQKAEKEKQRERELEIEKEKRNATKEDRFVDFVNNQPSPVFHRAHTI